MSETKKRILYPDVLKILAIFGVIMIHTTANMLGSCDTGTWKWQITNVFSGLVRFSVPVFFMASGIFFLNPEKEITGRKIFYKYLPRLIIALIFWGIAYEVFAFVLDWVKTGALHPTLLLTGLKNVLTAHGHFHLYFLYLIIGLYLVTPILRVFTKHATRRQLEYFLLLFFLFSGLLPLLVTFPPFSKLSAWITQMRMNVVTGYVGFFVAGYYFHKFTLSTRATRRIYLLGLLGGIVTILGTIWLSSSHGKLMTAFYEGLSPNVILMSFAVFLLVKNRMANGVTNLRRVRQISYLSKCTFGIYLVHDFFNMLSRTILSGRGLSLIDFNPLLVIPLYSLGVFVLSLGVTAILLKIPGVNRYLI